MMNPFPVIRADVRKTKAGVVAVICLIALAVALGIAVSSQERALRKGSARVADRFDLLIGAPGSQVQLVLTSVYLQPSALLLVPGEVIRHLQAEQGISFVAPLAFGDSFRGHPLVGSTAAFVTQGGVRHPAEGRIFRSMHEVVIGVDVPLRMGERFESVHGRSSKHDEADEDDHDATHKGFEYLVVGRMARLGDAWDRAIVAPVEALWSVHGLGTGHRPGEDRIGPPWDGDTIPGAPTLVVKPASVADAYRIRAAYRTSETMAIFPAEVMVGLYAILGDARDILAAISVGTQVLVIATVLLAVFASLALRRRDLAVLRALGASRSYIFCGVWMHVSVMITTGTVAGVFLGWAGACVLGHLFFLKTGITLPVGLGMEEVRMAAALIGVGFILAVIPSWSCYRQSVGTNLRA